MSDIAGGAGGARPGEPRSFAEGRYVVQERLGAGNFATVYLAWDERLDVPVAIKLLADHWSWEPEIRGRFVQEARLLRSLSDSRVVQIRDIAETDDGRPYIVMDYATEGTLEQRLAELAHRGDRPTASELRPFIAELATALAVLHSRRIAHRDLKPSNLLITRDDTPVANSDRRSDGLLRPGERLMLGDLGLAKDLRADSGVTVGVGTAGYMAPEQAGPGTRVDTRTDIYAASALVSQVATGEVPDPLRRYSDGATTSGRALPASIVGRFRTALEHGLDQDPAKRTPTIEAWLTEVDTGLAELEAAAGASGIATSTGGAPHRASARDALDRSLPKRRGRARVTMVALAMVAVIVAIVAFIVSRPEDSTRSGEDPNSSTTVAAAATTTPSTNAQSNTVATTIPALAPTTTAESGVPFVRIVGPTEVPAEEAQRWWEVEHLGVVRGTWSLEGPEGPIGLNGAQWSPGDGFQAGLIAGTYTLTLTAFDAAGNTYSSQLTFTSV